jgi:hypothetical protein
MPAHEKFTLIIWMKTADSHHHIDGRKVGINTAMLPPTHLKDK